MADKKDGMKDDLSDRTKNTKTSANSTNEDKKPKRRLRAAPVSVREQSERAQAKAGKPGKRSRVGRILGAPFRLIGRIFRPLGRFKPFRVLGYILAPPYFRNAWREVKQVTWPDRKKSRQLTFAVIVFSLVFGIIIAATDYGLDKLFRKVILEQ